MPQSLVLNYLHITFSTKYRKPFIDESIEVELFKYLGGICKGLGCNPIRVGGHQDHVHILCTLSRKIALMSLIEKVKSRSSKWIKTKGSDYANFYWQSGYGAFSVNPKEISVVEKYIINQKEHHQKQPYKDEFRKLLKQYNIPYDEKYVWD